MGKSTVREIKKDEVKIVKSKSIVKPIKKDRGKVAEKELEDVVETRAKEKSSPTLPSLGVGNVTRQIRPLRRLEDVEEVKKDENVDTGGPIYDPNSMERNSDMAKYNIRVKENSVYSPETANTPDEPIREGDRESPQLLHALKESRIEQRSSNPLSGKKSSFENKGEYRQYNEGRKYEDEKSKKRRMIT